MAVYISNPAAEIDVSLPQSGSVAGMLGDWLLTFAAEPADLPARLPGAPWRSERNGGDWRLYRASTAVGWRGSPLFSLTTPDWTAVTNFLTTATTGTTGTTGTTTGTTTTTTTTTT